MTVDKGKKSLQTKYNNYNDVMTTQNIIIKLIPMNKDLELK